MVNNRINAYVEEFGEEGLQEFIEHSLVPDLKLDIQELLEVGEDSGQDLDRLNNVFKERLLNGDL